MERRQRKALSSSSIISPRCFNRLSWSEKSIACLVILHTAIVLCYIYSIKKRSPAVVRIQGRGVAGTVAPKVKHLFGLCKDFAEKVRNWRWFLTDVGCGRYKMRHLQTKVGHLHTKGHGERYVGSLFRVDEPVPDD